MKLENAPLSVNLAIEKVSDSILYIKLMELADLLEFEKVDIYNINNGARFSTYVIPGESGQICLK